LHCMRIPLMATILNLRVLMEMMCFELDRKIVWSLVHAWMYMGVGGWVSLDLLLLTFLSLILKPTCGQNQYRYNLTGCFWVQQLTHIHNPASFKVVMFPSWMYVCISVCVCACVCMDACMIYVCMHACMHACKQTSKMCRYSQAVNHIVYMNGWCKVIYPFIFLYT